MNKALISKYNVAGPRYTSYPTVPYWENELFSTQAWKSSVVKSFRDSNISEGISLYIHLPFCESLCTFCGCHKRITKRHENELPYVEAVLKEWDLYLEFLPEVPIIKELHLGGGTPTFFSPEHLHQLISGILSKAKVHPNKEFSFEGHPNSTKLEHLKVLNSLGFTRVSFGVQDYNLHIQTAINRIQPFELVQLATERSRLAGYTSVSHDLVFGLPFQSIADIQFSIQKTIALDPDRISLYSYAHVPWLKGNGQRGFKDEDVPKDEEKQALYLCAKDMLLQNGYYEIGMDHFARAHDALYTAYKQGRLHRNFMGYTASKTTLMIGLGISSISDSGTAYAQNEKELDDYYVKIENGQLPVVKGHLLTEEDLYIKQHILDLMCRFKTSWNEHELRLCDKRKILENLEELHSDGLLHLDDDSVQLLEEGKMFVRNACMAFDLRLKRNQQHKRIFSSTI